MAILGQWRMNETSGTSVADAVGGNTGTASASFTVVPGVNGNARDGSAGSQQITFGSGYNVSTRGRDCWAKANASIPGAQRMVSFYPGGSHNDFIRLLDVNTVNAATDSANVNYTYTPGSTQRHYYYAINSSSSPYVKVYIDGVYKAQVTSGTPGSGTATFTISGHSGPGEYWTGSIDQVSLYSAHITDAGVKNNYAFFKGFI